MRITSKDVTGNIAKALGKERKILAKQITAKAQNVAMADSLMRVFGLTRNGFEMTLPYPPSINHYYGRGKRGNVFIKPEGRKFREDVRQRVDTFDPEGFNFDRVAIEYWMYPPDRRRRDIDNVQKALYDAMKHAGVYEDDCQIIDHAGHKMEYDGHGRIVVRVERAIRDTPTAA